MSYVDKNLMTGEHVVARARLHWITFLWSAIWFVVAFVVMVNNGPGGLFLLLAALAGVSAYITYSTSEFRLTNKRILVKVGFLKRHSLETLLTKVEGIQVDQGILGRMLGYGSIVVSGTGGSKEPFHKIAQPLEFRRKIQEQISNN